MHDWNYLQEKTKLAIADGRIAELSKQFAAVTLDDSALGDKRAAKLPPLPLGLGGEESGEFEDDLAGCEVPKTPTPNPSTVAAIEAVLKPQRPSAFQPVPAFSTRAVSNLTRVKIFEFFFENFAADISVLFREITIVCLT